MFKERLDSIRLESVADSEEAVAELSRRHDRDKAMLLDENKKLMIEMESVRTACRSSAYVVGGLKKYIFFAFLQARDALARMQAERRQLENDYEDLRTKKDAIAQWEAQITEIIQW